MSASCSQTADVRCARAVDTHEVGAPAAGDVIPGTGRPPYPTEEERALGSAPEGEAKVSFPQEDVELVMSQTGCDAAKAVEALEATDGQPAEAIIKIMSE